jgi:hypothetical protein
MICNISKDVLEYMSQNEVARTIGELRDEASNLEDWNNRRGHWEPPTPRWQNVPPPKSMAEYDWRMRSRR